MAGDVDPLRLIRWTVPVKNPNSLIPKIPHTKSNNNIVIYSGQNSANCHYIKTSGSRSSSCTFKTSKKHIKLVSVLTILGFQGTQ